VIVVHTVLYGLLAGASALAATAVLVVLRTGHTRLNGIAFAIGFLAAQLFVCVLALAFGTDNIPRNGSSHRVIEALIELALGVALLLAARKLHTPPAPPRPRVPRPHVAKFAAQLDARRVAMLDRIGSLHPPAILGTGALLGIGGPKRLVLTLLASAAIATAQVSRTGETTLVAVYVALATILVWVPVLLAVVWGDRAAEWTATAQRWWADRKATALIVPLLVVGAALVVNGIVDLVQA
jgi:hypothetical protein